jgi:hypothetical protein
MREGEKEKSGTQRFGARAAQHVFGGSPKMSDTTAELMTVVNALIAAENAHDADAATALFAEDGVAKLAVETRTGHEQIRAWQQSLADGDFHVELAGEPQIEGNKVTYHNKVDLKMFKNLGLGTVEAVSEAVIEGGKIKHYTFALTPEYGAKLREAMAAGAKLAN